ncbi:MAG: biopolymer transporter ExbD [Bacteroidales bacterium]|nr:biopolymer transporter ExbD [Bacteroidales bacterium]
MARRDTPEINAGSMADIAFLLLIFFLVATTMDIDSGMLRQLPPPVPEDLPPPPEVKERNVFVVLVNRNDQLLVEGEVLNIKDLKERTKEFLLNPNDESNLPEKKWIENDILGDIQVTKGIISLQNDNGTSYKMYVKVMNELVAAGNEIKEEFSRQQFGKGYDDLTEDEKDAVKDARPAMISEAEPKNIGG